MLGFWAPRSIRSALTLIAGAGVYKVGLHRIGNKLIDLAVEMDDKILKGLS